MAESVQELSVNALLNFTKLLSVILKVFLDHIEIMFLEDTRLLLSNIECKYAEIYVATKICLFLGLQ